MTKSTPDWADEIAKEFVDHITSRLLSKIRPFTAGHEARIQNVDFTPWQEFASDELAEVLRKAKAAP